MVIDKQGNAHAGDGKFDRKPLKPVGKLAETTPKIDAFFDRVKSITPEQGHRMHIVRDELRSKAVNVTRNAARDAIGEEATWKMSQLVNAKWSEAQSQARAELQDDRQFDEWNVAHIEAQYAVWDACLALTARDLISEEQFETLYKPWATVMEPKEPEEPQSFKIIGDASFGQLLVDIRSATEANDDYDNDRVVVFSSIDDLIADLDDDL
jgi:hypothetical protein